MCSTLLPYFNSFTTASNLRRCTQLLTRFSSSSSLLYLSFADILRIIYMSSPSSADLSVAVICLQLKFKNLSSKTSVALLVFRRT